MKHQQVPGDSASSLTERWVTEYRARSKSSLVDVKLGTYTYTFDVATGRLVCAAGYSTPPQGPRDSGRQKGHPPAPPGSHKGHVFAHSMGGGMDINIVPQLASVNQGKDWRAIERFAAANPGTAVAVRLIYDDDSDRPAAFEYGVEKTNGELEVQYFDNREQW